MASGSPTTTLARPLGLPTAVPGDEQKAQFNGVLPGVIAATVALIFTAGILVWMHIRRKRRRAAARRRISTRQKSMMVESPPREFADRGGPSGHGRTTSLDARARVTRGLSVVGGYMMGRQRGSARLESPPMSDGGAAGYGNGYGKREKDSYIDRDRDYTDRRRDYDEHLERAREFPDRHRSERYERDHQDRHQSERYEREPPRPESPRTRLAMQLPKNTGVHISIDDPLSPGPQTTLTPAIAATTRSPPPPPIPASPRSDHSRSRRKSHRSPSSDRDRRRSRESRRRTRRRSLSPPADIEALHPDFDEKRTSYIRPGSFVGIERWVMAVSEAAPWPPEPPTEYTVDIGDETETDAYSYTTHGETTDAETTKQTHISQIQQIQLASPPLTGQRSFIMPQRTNLSTASSMLQLSRQSGGTASPFNSPPAQHSSRFEPPVSPNSLSSYPFPINNTFDTSNQLSPQALASSGGETPRTPRTPFSDDAQASTSSRPATTVGGASRHQRSESKNRYDPAVLGSPVMGRGDQHLKSVASSPSPPAALSQPPPRRLSYRPASRSLSTVYRDPDGDDESIAPGPASSAGRAGITPAPTPAATHMGRNSAVPPRGTGRTTVSSETETDAETGEGTDTSLSVMGDPSVWPQPPPSVMSDRSGMEMRESLGDLGMMGGEGQDADGNGLRPLTLGLGPPGWEGMFGLDGPNWDGRGPSRAGTMRNRGMGGGQMSRKGSVADSVRSGGSRAGTANGSGLPISSQIPLVSPKSTIREEEESLARIGEGIIRVSSPPTSNLAYLRSSESQPTSPITPKTAGSSSTMLGQAWSPRERTASLMTTSTGTTSRMDSSSRGISTPATSVYSPTTRQHPSRGSMKTAPMPMSSGPQPQRVNSRYGGGR